MPDHNIPIGKGVAMTVPPPDLMASIDRHVTRLLAPLPPDKTVAIVAVATSAGANLAIMGRVNHVWTAQAYVGKTWGQPLDIGGQVVASW